MTNPTDTWRHQTSAKPHDTPHDPRTAGLPLGETAPAMQLGGSGEPLRYTTPPDPVSLGVGLLLAGAFATFVFSGLIFPVLYPMASAVALAAGVLANSVLHAVAPRLDSASQLPFIMLAVVVVFWPMSRFDHRLAATVRLYRYARHGVRILLFASVFTLISLNDVGLPRTPAQIQMVFANRLFLPVWGVAAVIAHFLLRRRSMRAKWDAGLEIFGLRPRNLDS